MVHKDEIMGMIEPITDFASVQYTVYKQPTQSVKHSKEWMRDDLAPDVGVCLALAVPRHRRFSNSDLDHTQLILH